MQGSPEIVVLRLGHRPGRDERMTTHVGLTARALGADSVVFVGEAASAVENITDVTARFGGPFSATLTDTPNRTIRDWSGVIVHLTMYGEPIHSVEDDVRSTHFDAGQPLLVIVGAGKVSFDVYEAADWNVGITNQPHSEVASLAIFLDRLFEGRELEREWAGGTHQIVPMAMGKRVEPVDETIFEQRSTEHSSNG